VVAVAFMALDSVWLSLTGEALYHRHLGDILLDGFRPVPAALFYLLYVSGLMVFAVEPARAEGRLAGAAFRGAFLGLVAYGTYDLTNQATLKIWPTVVTSADLAWGMTASAAAASAGLIFLRRRAARQS
jgi:uncharacterized membrane protein